LPKRRDPAGPLPGGSPAVVRGQVPGSAFLMCVLLAAIAGCGGAGPAQGRPAPMRGGRAEPDTDADPAFYTPRPGNGAAARGAVAARASGLEQQAMNATVRLVRALIEEDADALRELFEESLLYAGRRRNVPRERVVKECLKHAARQAWQSGTRVGDVLMLGSIAARRAGDGPAERPLPEGIRPFDLEVEFRLRSKVPGASFLCFQRATGKARIYVRPGPSPRIASFSR
jgi:hypothetical protein